MNARVMPFDASIAILPPTARFNLRVAQRDRAAASKAFGFDLPATVGAGVRDGERSAWCLGPDEWLLPAPEPEEQVVVGAFAAIRQTAPHSLTVISDREIALSVEGAGATELLTVGCPIDLRRVMLGGAKRTVFDGVQIVLIRDGAEAWRLEIWRSFLSHVQGLLEIACHEFALDR